MEIKPNDNEAVQDSTPETEVGKLAKVFNAQDRLEAQTESTRA